MTKALEPAGVDEDLAQAAGGRSWSAQVIHREIESAHSGVKASITVDDIRRKLSIMAGMSGDSVLALDIQKDGAKDRASKVVHPPAGMMLHQDCEGRTLMGVYADGGGGTVRRSVEFDSPRCGGGS